MTDSAPSRMASQESTTGDPLLERLHWAVLCAALCFVLFATARQNPGDAVFSRIATVHALAQHGSFIIEDTPERPNPFAALTIDKVMTGGERIGNSVRGGHIISSKPPLLPLIMTAEYLAIHKVSGLELTEQRDFRWILYIMTITLTGASYLGCLWCFHRTLRWMGLAPLISACMLALCAFATQLWGYGVVITNHVPAAFALCAAACITAGLLRGASPTRWRFALFGFAAALAFTVDMPSTAFPAALGCVLAWRWPRRAIPWGILGAALPLIIHFSVNWAVTGSLMPVQMRPEVYHFENAYWRHPGGVDAMSEPKTLYAINALIGNHGVLTLFPILWLGVAGVFAALFQRGYPARAMHIALGAGFAIAAVYYVSSTNNYGGEAYGFRWFIPSMPVLLIIAAPLVNTLIAKRWGLAIFALLTGVSFYSAWECSTAPWSSLSSWTRRLLG